MRKIGLFVIIVSIIVLVATCVTWGFYDKIVETGFNPTPLLITLIILSCFSPFIGMMMCVGIFDNI